MLHDPDSIDEVEKDIRILSEQGIVSSEIPAARPEFEAAGPAALEAAALARRSRLLDSLDSIAASLPESSETLEALTESAGTGAVETRARRIKLLRIATVALNETLRIGAEIYFGSDIASLGGEGIEEEIERRQRQMVKQVKPFLRPGVPGKWRIWGKVPERGIALYAALQEVTEQLTGVVPPLVLTFKPEGGAPVSLISPRES